MPTIEINKKDFEKLIKRRFNMEKLSSIMNYVKGELEFENKKEDNLKLELKDVNRPDLWSVEGVVRELKHRLGIKKGLIKYSVQKPEKNHLIKVSPKVRKVRPVSVGAIVRNLKLNEEALKQLIQLQEKLCINFGLKRKEAALGVYDFDKIKWPINYTTFRDNEIKFVPLGFSYKMSPSEIIEKHEKGMEYGKLVEGKDYPILIDSEKNVLSMPPIINSDYSGKVTKETRNVFVEVSGFDLRFVLPVLNIFICALIERGGEVEQVLSTGPKRIATPNLESKEILININEINKILGISLTKKEIFNLLEKSGFDYIKDKNGILIKYPCYRYDILDSRDVIEDIAISYGFNNFKPEKFKESTFGCNSKFTEFKYKVKEMMIGLESQEIATFVLTEKDKLFKTMRLKNLDVIEIANPVSLNYSCLRNWLLPSLMEFLGKNKDVEYPQKIFEIGECIEVEKDSFKNLSKLAYVYSGKDVNFTIIKQQLDYLLRSLKINYKTKKLEHASFISGRCGEVIIKKENREISIGFLGEIHPAILEKFNLIMPTVAFEINLNKLV